MCGFAHVGQKGIADVGQRARVAPVRKGRAVLEGLLVGWLAEQFGVGAQTRVVVAQPLLRAVGDHVVRRHTTASAPPGVSHFLKNIFLHLNIFKYFTKYGKIWNTLALAKN
jgi:hypothetical protein